MATSTHAGTTPFFSQSNKGAWNSGTSYVVGDIVTNGGSTYVAVTASTNQVVTNPTYWSLMAGRGSNGIPLINLLDNGNFQVWQRGSSSTSSPTTTHTFLTDRWAVNPSGAAVAQIRDTGVPDIKSQYSLKVTGATSATTVLVSQRLESFWSALYFNTTLTFSVYVYNGTGASFTPSLLVGTPAATNDFTTVANKLTQVLATCADGVWTRVTYSFDPSAYTNIGNGVQVELQFPSGTLDSGSKVIKLSQIQLEQGASFTAFSVVPPKVDLDRCDHYYHIVTGSRYGSFWRAQTVIADVWNLARVPDDPPTILNNACNMIGWGSYATDYRFINSCQQADISFSTTGGTIVMLTTSNNLQNTQVTHAFGFALGVNAELL